MLSTEGKAKEELCGVFDPTVVTVAKPQRHFSYVNTPDGDWLALCDDGSLHVQGFVDDAVIWEDRGESVRHVASGVEIAKAAIADKGGPANVEVRHGPEKLPSTYLAELQRKGWVSLTCVLAPEVVDGLQRVGRVDAYEDLPQRDAPPLAQHPAVAEASVEPLSLWLTRQYLGTRDIRLGHSPGVSALTEDDGEREVQGWHTDFPYLWGTGDRIPAPSGELVLGVQRNTCVSDFTKENGATLFKLGSHASNSAPPPNWGLSRETYQSGHRAEFGLPYGGAEADVIEAPAGSIILYDARTWHRAGVNRTQRRRGAMIQALTPGFIMPFMDTSATYRAFIESDACEAVSARTRREVEKLMLHKIVGPAGTFAITIDPELTERVREEAE